MFPVEIGRWFPEANELISKKSNYKLVLPSFVLTFSNFIMLALSKHNIMMKDRTVHVEQNIDIICPLKPEGIITYDLKEIEIIDKGKGTLFTFNREFDFVREKPIIFNSNLIITVYGRDEDENEMFFLQKKFYEINIHRQVGKQRSNEQTSKQIEVPTKIEPDQVFEFKTKAFNSTMFFNPTPNDMKESLFSPNHWRQYHDITKHFKSEPNCHGRYYLGAVINQILDHFANGDATLLKRVQVINRFFLFRICIF